ncbi:hypothetical protein G9A89_008163 [Geosiphon pyriformis]|nr:hypothetical protein G9A89_008163 [Geosiphon pyriformis]
MSWRNAVLTHLSSYVLQGEEFLWILQGNSLNNFAHSVILWNIRTDTEGGYTITHNLTSTASDQEVNEGRIGETCFKITRHFLSKHEVSLVDLGIIEFRIIVPAIPYLQTLCRLSIAYNKLKILPSSLFQLANLQILHIHSNELISLPPQIGLLTSLRELDLHANQITRIPQQISLCTQCNWVNLEKNQISYLPVEIFLLRQLRQLRLDGNPFGVIAFENTVVGSDRYLPDNDGNFFNTGNDETVILRANQNLMPLSDICAQVAGITLINQGCHTFCLSPLCKTTTTKIYGEDCIYKFLPSEILQRIILSYNFPPTKCSQCCSPLFHDGVEDYYYYGEEEIPVIYLFCSYACRTTLRKSVRAHYARHFIAENCSVQPTY